MNAKKTKKMVMSKGGTRPETLKLIIYGSKTGQVKPFTYLGQLITESGRCDEELLNYD